MRPVEKLMPLHVHPSPFALRRKREFLSVSSSGLTYCSRVHQSVLRKKSRCMNFPATNIVGPRDDVYSESGHHIGAGPDAHKHSYLQWDGT